MMIESQIVKNLKVDRNGFLIFNNGMRIQLDDIPYTTSFYVDALIEHRAHLLSEAAFNTVNYTDLMLMFNNIINPFYIPIGTYIRVPDLTFIQSKLQLYLQTNDKLIAATQSTNVVKVNALTAKSSESKNTILSDGRIVFIKQ
jgi:hypothetical protein